MIVHRPVLLAEVLDRLVTDTDGLYVDATLGDGGHSAGILDRLGPEGKVVGVDRDPRAIEVAQARLGHDPRFSCVKLAFSAIHALPQAQGARGVLMDFGVSSRQIDEDARGFTVRPGVKLDMRMDPDLPHNVTEAVRATADDDLAHWLKTWADVPHSRKVALSLRAMAAVSPLVSDDLGRALDCAFPNGQRDARGNTHRVAQGLRMLVNDEPGEIRSGLHGALQALAVGGRLAVITYHSAEDRLAMASLRSFVDPPGEPDPWGRRPDPDGAWVARKIRPSSDEIETNPRARSATLRVVERRRGMTLGTTLGLLLAAVAAGSVLAGQVWRQQRHVELRRDLIHLQTEDARLRDSLSLLRSADRAARAPDRIARLAPDLGLASPLRTWRIPDVTEGAP